MAQGKSLDRQGGARNGRWYTLLELDPRHHPARLNLTWVLRRTGRSAAALTYLEELVRLHPSHLGAHLRRAELRAVYRDRPRAAVLGSCGVPAVQLLQDLENGDWR